MSLASSLGQLLTTGLNLTLPSPSVTVDPNAWRLAMKKGASTAANYASTLGRPWSDFVTKMVAIAFNASSATPDRLRSLRALVKEPYYVGYWNPAWPSDALTKIRAYMAEVDAALPPVSAPPVYTAMPGSIAVTRTPVISMSLPPAPPPPAPAPPPAPPPPAPPPISVARPEVECTDGYVRDAEGLCVPGAAAPGPTVAPDVVVPPGVLLPSRVVVDSPPPSTPVGPATPARVGPMGISLKWWGLGAAGLVVAGFLLSSRKVTPNRRRRRHSVRRNVGHVVAGTRVRGPGGSGTVSEVFGDRASVRWDGGGPARWVSKSSLTRNSRRKVRRNVGQVAAGTRVHGPHGLGTIVEIHGDNARVRWDMGPVKWIKRSALDRV